MEENQSDTQLLINHYKKLMSYKNNLFKLDTLISLEKDPDTHQELTQMRSDLLQAISYQEDVVRFTQNTEDYYFSVDRLVNTVQGRIAKAYNEKQQKWYNAEILNIDVENQEAEVQFLGLKEKQWISSVFIKLLPVASASVFQVGVFCEAIYTEDGKFFPCVIERIDGENYHVKFKKYNNREIKSIYQLRESKNSELNKKIQFENLESFKLPEHLKILPNDSEEQRSKKKKKIKALKQSFRNAQYEKDNQDKQSSWDNFRDHASKQNKGYFKNHKKDSIFRSPETIDGKVGVVNSGKGITHQKSEANNAGYQQKKYGGSNSHLYKIY